MRTIATNHTKPIILTYAHCSPIQSDAAEKEAIYDPCTQTSTLEAGLMGTRSLKYTHTPKIGGGGYTADYKNAIDDSKWQ